MKTDFFFPRLRPQSIRQDSIYDPTEFLNLVTAIIIRGLPTGYTRSQFPDLTETGYLPAHIANLCVQGRTIYFRGSSVPQRLSDLIAGLAIRIMAWMISDRISMATESRLIAFP